MKEYTVHLNYKGRIIEVNGNLAELTKYFAYTLECGKSWNRKINSEPKTIKSLITNVNKAYQEQQRGSFEQIYVELVK